MREEKPTETKKEEKKGKRQTWKGDQKTEELFGSWRTWGAVKKGDEEKKTGSRVVLKGGGRGWWAMAGKRKGERKWIGIVWMEKEKSLKCVPFEQVERVQNSELISEDEAKAMGSKWEQFKEDERARESERVKRAKAGAKPKRKEPGVSAYRLRPPRPPKPLPQPIVTPQKPKKGLGSRKRGSPKATPPKKGSCRSSSCSCSSELTRSAFSCLIVAPTTPLPAAGSKPEPKHVQPAGMAVRVNSVRFDSISLDLLSSCVSAHRIAGSW